MPEAALPTATYRLQLGRELTFAAARELVGYFEALGVSHLYLSPVYAAQPGSTHGYDVVDPGALNPVLGTEEDFRALAEELQRRSMSLVLDVVPNHLCVSGPENRWWSDVLENGPASPYAAYFDIDWAPPKPDLADKVLLPVLGEQYGRALEGGRLRVTREGGSFHVQYGELRLPLAPKSWPVLLDRARERLSRAVEPDDPALVELQSILTAIAHLPGRSETEPEKVEERLREKGVIRRRLAQLLEGAAAAREAVEASLREVNGRPGDPRSFDRLEALLADQAYRLSHWRVASDEINYRRFFDINELAAIRVELPEVFEAVHALPLRLVDEGLVTGLRVDHADGLYDPPAYLSRLERVPYVVVEKILTGGERLPSAWPVAGTTGYEFLNALNGLFVEPGTHSAFREIYERFTGLDEHPADVAYEARKLVLGASLSAELTVIGRRLDRISEQHRYSRDFTLRSLEHVLAETIACFPVYRTYLRPDETAPSAADRAHVETALARAHARNPAVSRSLFDFLGDVLLCRDPDGLDEAQRGERREFVMRFQQLTGPVMAKGLEDTAAYRFLPLASLAEVGAGAGGWGTSLAEFHAFAEERQRRWPLALSATSTHDTKRDEDVRARLNVLSEIPLEWEQALHRFRLATRGRRNIGPEDAPDGNDEYLFYQTVFGTWPLEEPPGSGYAERVQAYMRKAVREAKRHTSWIDPEPEYEEALEGFVAAALDPERGAAFREAMGAFVGRYGPAGLLSGAAQALLKAAAPGVPDVYQGTEIPEFRLVDPDNRGPVDFDRRRSLLARLDGEASGTGLGEGSHGPDGSGGLKMWVTRCGLRLRRERPALFAEGDYVPLLPAGERAAHVIAFARVRGEEAVVAAAGRFFAQLPDPPVGAGVWGRTSLGLGAAPGGRFRDVLAGREVDAVPAGGRRELPLGDVFARAPFALLVRSGAGGSGRARRER